MPLVKSQILGRIVCSGISVALVYSEKTHLKMLMIVIILMNIARNDNFRWAPERPEK